MSIHAVRIHLSRNKLKKCLQSLTKIEPHEESHETKEGSQHSTIHES